MISADVTQTDFGQKQCLVDSYFRSSSDYWRDVYEEQSLDALIYRQRKAVVLEMVDQLGLPAGCPVLEVGCGAGLTTVALAKRGYAVDAIDTVEAMIRLTRDAALDAGVSERVSTRLSSVLEITFPSCRFDLVVAMGVLPWIDRAPQALLEIGRVLKPGGYAIVTADNHWCLSQSLDPLCFPGLRRTRWRVADALQKLGLRKPSRPRLYRHSVRQIDSLLLQAGLKKTRGVTLGFGPFTFFKQKLLPDRIGIKLHSRLQALADRRIPVFRSAGTEYVVAACKSPES